MRAPQASAPRPGRVCACSAAPVPPRLLGRLDDDGIVVVMRIESVGMVNYLKGAETMRF